MAVVIRLTRRGRKKLPFYRIGVFEASTRRDGASIENLGYYDPIAKGKAKQLELNEERVKHWLSVGAKPSDTVASFLRSLHIQYKDPVARRARQHKRQEKH